METQAPAAEPATRRRIPTLAVAVAVLVVLIVLDRLAGGWVTPYLAAAGRWLSGQITAFALWVNSLGIWGPVAFMVGYVVATVAFVPGSFLTMAGGAIFGLLGGTAYVLCAATVGASAAFVISRYLARGAVERKLRGNEKFAAIDRAVGEQGLKIVTLLRLSPVFPFNLLNYGLGLTGVRFRDYLLACLAMLPGTFLYVYYGKAVGDVAALAAGERAEQGAEQWVFLALGLAATIAVTALVTRLARRALRQVTG